MAIKETLKLSRNEMDLIKTALSLWRLALKDKTKELEECNSSGMNNELIEKKHKQVDEIDNLFRKLIR